MSLGAGDLGVLGNLAKALGLFDASGNPNGDWFAHPEASLKTMLADPAQRAALIAFVDEAMGGADRSTDAGVIWLPIVAIEEPPLSIAVTIDESQADGLHIGLGLRVTTTDPASATTLAVPLFRAQKQGGPSVSQPLLLGSPGGRIRIGTSITVDAAPAVPGQARLGGIGIDVDLPTSPSDTKGPVFGLALTGLQLPGAPSPRDVRVSADGADELDDALLDLVLSLVKAQADALTADPQLAALAGLLGLKSGDAVPDFPITELPTRGVIAIADWVRGLLAQTGSRNDWLAHLAALIGGARVGDAVEFDLGAATLTLALRVDTGPSGNPRLTPTLGLELGNADARVEARAELFRIDLVTGAAFALPSLGLWAAAGRAGNPILDITNPATAHADTLRIGFALDAQRRLNFVLAADVVTLGEHSYATLDLTSPDAVMDAVDNTVGDIANLLLAGLGDALGVVKQLIGLDAPAGVTAVTLPALMADPLAAVGAYWQQLVTVPAAARNVLGALRTALTDAGQALAVVQGDGSSDVPWTLPLIGPLQLEVAASGPVLTIGLAAATSVDTLGQRCTVVQTRFAATLARIDLAARSADLLPAVEATLTARERGANPPRARLVLADGVAFSAQHVGLRLAWSPQAGLSAGVSAPSLALETDDLVLPISLPVIAGDGSVTLPPEAWDGVQALVGRLGALIGGILGDVVHALGWVEAAADTSGEVLDLARLRLADIVNAPEAALRAWLPQLAMSELGPRALGLVADLFGGAGAARGVIDGTGHPDDPYRFAIAEGLPNVAVWFPPAGLEPRLIGASQGLQSWRPGQAGLGTEALVAALQAEAEVDTGVRELVEGRDLAAGLTAIAQRWIGGDGRSVPPSVAPAGITVRRVGLAASQLFDQLDLEDLTGRVPTTTVYVALGADAWPDAPADRRVDLATAGLAATMFPAPTAATGDWFVALGTRADCRVSGSSTDGTPEQAARLGRVLDALAAVSNDIALVALHGAGHAARVAAQAQVAVTDLVLLGTPLAPVSLTALSVQPTADALRLLQRLLPEPDGNPDDADLALGRGLVAALMELAALTDPAAELRPSVAVAEAPRAGLAVCAQFGVVSESQVSAALTAIVAAGLAQRARERAATPLPDPTGVHAGLRWVLPIDATGTVTISGRADLQLFAFDQGSGIDTSRVLRVQLRIGDRLGWLASTPELELRAVSADLTLPLDGTSPGSSRVVLHDGRVFGQSWEALALGNLDDDAVAVLPEARVLLAAAIQRLTADLGGTASLALGNLLKALGLVAANGGVVGDAVDQLVHDPAGLVRQRLASAGADIAAGLNSLLGPLGASLDLPTRTVRVLSGGSALGRFGWQADVSASPSALNGQLRFGPDAALPTVGGLQLQLDLNPLRVSLHWHRSGGSSDVATLWPAPDGQALARMLAQAAPSLGAHVALEVMRRADATARPVIDAALDALGLLAGAATDAERALRPLAGLIQDPAGWLRSAGSLAANPVKIQALFDALRPLMGLPGANGAPIALATGVSLAVAADGPGARLTLQVDPSGWTAPNGVTARLSGGIGASLTVGPSGAPSVGLETHVGLDGSTPGRQAVYARIGSAGLEVFLRPATGADIRLLPFSGLGSLSDVAQAALPFLLDRLAEIAGTPGALVRTVGDALALRKGTPTKTFDGDALRAWAANPVGALTAAVPSIVSTGLATLAPLVDDFLPAGVNAAATANEISVTVAGVTLAWNPSTGRVSLAAPAIAVPGIHTLGATLAISAAGLDELSLAIGPAEIDAGGVILRPFASIAAGLNPVGGRRVMVGLSANATHHFAARWTLDTARFDVVASDGVLATAIATTDPAQVALRIVEIVADLVAAVAMAQQAVKDLLDTDVGAQDVRFLLQGVVLADVTNPTQLIAGVFDPATLLARVHRLFANLAGAGIAITLDGLKLTFTKIAGSIGLQVGVVDRFALVSGDVSLWLENDDRWIVPDPPGDGGLFVGVLPDTLPLRFTPSLVVNGLGLRVGKSSGPLLDAGITLESIALHAYAAIDTTGAKSGGVQLQFSNLAVSASGAKGENGIAQGIMRDTGPTPPKPAFSPALAIQVHNGGPVQVSLTAGDGAGPWWIAIQKGFGPLYLEQIGFGATMPQGKLERISLLMDGSVSMFGLTCAVDDLQITYIVGNNDFFNPASWAIDLAGLAVSADMAGVTLAGGLLKQSGPQGIEYLGMLLGRFGVYGLTVYGGYGEGVSNGQKFTAFFAIGAVNGPIGGPPAFFLTGIGGGFGINRKLVVPTELANFGDYPLIQALDIAATPSDPMTQLRALGAYFPMSKGTFWFAAGLSFNSFALVDGIAVVGVQVGDGLDINLLGLARMALPRPQVALVSIELALLVRFSSSEGVLWVQGQLTDNSWLLYPDIKLTGGFAYVIWFKGEKSGEFVLTMGGYHPDFHRDGYPVVPRLGLRWSIGDNIVIKAGSYFALTSEALMAGGDFEASAHFGPAWAEVKFGAHGIVFFDPFHYDVSAYARIAAGVTIDTWIFGEITISISLGARIHVLGPDFRGSVTFEVGPIELTFEFGGSGQEQKQPLAADAFIAKYLEAADSGQARPHALMANTGALPAKGEKATPDGSSSRPFVVVVEFSMTFTSTVPATRINRVLAPAAITITTHPPSRAIGIAPMEQSDVVPTIRLTWMRGGVAQPYPFVDTVRPFGRFPVGVWGPPQDANNRQVPKAEMLEALSELDLVCRALPSPGGPEIPYYQVEINKRLPLPFTRSALDVAKLRTLANDVTVLLAPVNDTETAYLAATKFLKASATPTALASLRGERQAPPRLGTLTEGIETPTETTIPAIADRPPTKVYDHFIDAPVVVGLLSGATVGLAVAPKAKTTVKGSERAWRTAPPTLAGVEAQRSRSIAARLVLTDTPAQPTANASRIARGATLIAAQNLPPTAVAHAATALVARAGAALAAPLTDFNAALAVGARRRAANAGATLAAGQTVVLKLPNARADAVPDAVRPTFAVADAPARVVLLGHGGRRLADTLLGPGLAASTVEVPRGTERIVAIGQGATVRQAGVGLMGWHAGLQMPYAGNATAIGPGCVVHANGERLALHRERLDAGWVNGAELARGTSTLTTTFVGTPRTVVVVLDDPASAGDNLDGRQLLLGLDGAARALDGAGHETPPVLLAMDNRSVLAYDVVPDGDAPVVVTIASQDGWSLVGVMASNEVDATGAVALISARGLDAALQPFATTSATEAATPSRVAWLAPTRTDDQRATAKAHAQGGGAVAALTRRRAARAPTRPPGGRR